jgi:hypothetical protein
MREIVQAGALRCIDIIREVVVKPVDCSLISDILGKATSEQRERPRIIHASSCDAFPDQPAAEDTVFFSSVKVGNHFHYTLAVNQ